MRTNVLTYGSDQFNYGNRGAQHTILFAAMLAETLLN